MGGPGATRFTRAKAMRDRTQFNNAVAIMADVGGLSAATALMRELNTPPIAHAEDRILVFDEAIDQLGQAPR